jgi:hypothetical protein
LRQASLHQQMIMRSLSIVPNDKSTGILRINEMEENRGFHS